MTTKEISVFIIGLMLVGFLYVMRNPTNNIENTNYLEPITAITTSKSTGNTQSNFDPSTKFPTLESILDIPALTFDFADIEARTSEELVKSIKLAITEKRYFRPENKNALFFLVNLKSIDSDNVNIKDLTQELTEEITLLAQQAIDENNAKILTSTISRLKTLETSKNSIIYLEEKLTSIKIINKLYSKGIKQLHNNNIVNEDSEDAWHTAKQCLEVDKTNVKTKSLVAQVNGILVNNALRAAEESDFQIANNKIELADLLTPNNQLVIEMKNKIEYLKEKRQIWLKQQISIAINKNNLARSEKMLLQLEDLGLESSQLQSYKNEIIRIKIYGKYAPLEIITNKILNNQDLPKMVVMPIGNYIMGSKNTPKYETPIHPVNINYAFAVSQNEISVADFRLFINKTDYKTDAEKSNSSKIYDLKTGRLKNKNRITWEKNYIGKKSSDEYPAIHVSWNDAVAYTKWLSQITGKTYRLLTESEFEYVLRAGSSSYYPWGDGTPSEIIENLTGKLDKSKDVTRAKWKKGFDKYNDRHWGPAPTGSFINNSFKLNDLSGNVMEWVMDCWHDSYARAPIDGSSWSNPGCNNHVIRGGSWSSAKKEYASSHRFKARANFTDARLGFRIALELSVK